jgi:hypothetical protein
LSFLPLKTRRVLDRGLCRREAELEADNIILYVHISILNAQIAILEPGLKKKAVRKKRNLNAEFSDSRDVVSKKNGWQTLSEL